MAYEIGQLVEVTKAYRGGGCYTSDGREGIYTVVGALRPNDYYLVRGDLRHDPRKAHWDLIAHETRLKAA